MKPKFSRISEKIIPILSHSWVLYSLCALLLVSNVNKDTALLNHLNFLKDTDSYLQEFYAGERPIFAEKFKEGILYYKKLADFFPNFKTYAYSNMGF